MKHFLFFLFCFCFKLLPAQFTPELDRFSAVQKDGSVYLDWTLSAGSVCLGIDIQRADDSGTFKTIGSISGICGHLTKSVHYSFTDEFPIQNISLRYRLSYGGLGVSDPLSIIVYDVGKDDYKLFPNPSKDIFSLSFYNPRQETHTLRIINSSGVEVYTSVVNTDVVQIDLSDMDPGLYQFFIGNETLSNTSSGRLIISD